jgi:aldehyde:ferredoxin oxidoreductase
MKNYPKGYTGNLLRVNLTDRKISRERLDAELLRRQIGGRGLNAAFLCKEIRAGVDPLSPENKLLFSVGPCNGTIISGSQRISVGSKSPLTGFLGDSNCGGDIGAELKYAGYDMLIIEGRSEKPVYLWIQDSRVEIKDASQLWGKTTYETRRAVEREINDPNACLAMIGPAGENMVRFASIMMDIGRAAGRSGMGAVMGSKNLKAIAVRGTGGITVADPAAIDRLVKEDHHNWRTGMDGQAHQAITAFGVTLAWVPMQMFGTIATNNFQGGSFETNMLVALDENRFIAKQKACFSCSLGCNHSYILKNGPYAGAYGEGLQLVHLVEGPRLGVQDMGLMLKIGSLMDGYGMDFIDSSASIAYALECFQRGILTPQDVDGLSMGWGEAESILKLQEMIATRKGIGDILADGLKRAAKQIGKGSEDFIMHAKGQAIVPRDPRASKGWGLMFAVSSRGGCHVRAFMPEGYIQDEGMQGGIWPPDCLKRVETYDDPLNQLKEEGKPELVKFYEDYRAFQDSMEICRFSLFNVLVDAQNKPVSDYMAKFINAVTGWDYTGEEVMRTGDRIVNQERLFNLREGMTKKDDGLPKRMMKEPMHSGEGAGEVIGIEKMVDKYYEVRGWNKETGVPEKEKMEELSLL